MLNFDASLNGLGIRLFYCLGTEKGFCFKIIHVSLSKDKFSFSNSNNSAFQNAVEFLAETIGLFVLLNLGFKNCSIIVEGDSISALSWAATRTFKTGPSFYAASAQMAIALRENLAIHDKYIHLSVKDSVIENYDTDFISRNNFERVSARYPSDSLISLHSDPWLYRVLDVLNPELSSNDDMNVLCTFWNDLDSVISETINLSNNFLSSNFSLHDTCNLQLFISGPNSKRKFSYS